MIGSGLYNTCSRCKKKKLMEEFSIIDNYCDDCVEDMVNIVYGDDDEK